MKGLEKFKNKTIKTKIVSLRLEKETHEAILKIVKKYNMKISDFWRVCIEDYLKKIK